MRYCTIFGVAVSLCLDCPAAAHSNTEKLGPYLGQFHSTYVTADLSAGHELSRLDISDINTGLRAVTFRFSPAAASDAERARSENGGTSRFIDAVDYAGTDVLMLQYPKAGINSWKVNWQNGAADCGAELQPEAKMLITCAGGLTGTAYSSLYSARRGFEWMDQPCGREKCRYILTSAEGLFTSRMDAELRRRQLFIEQPTEILQSIP